MKVAEAVVKILEKEGITDSFGIPGASINGLYKYLEPSSIKHYMHRHEECCVHAAGGFYRASHKMAAAICTSGPGATNFVTGLYSCMIDSIPVIAITGQGARSKFGQEAFQCIDFESICKTQVKKVYTLVDPEKVPEIFHEGFKIAREGRPGPVVFDFPIDVQSIDIDFDIENYTPYKITKPCAKSNEIKKAVDMIKSAKKPLMLMGGGVILSEAEKEFVALAEQLNTPVITTYMAKGGIATNHELNCGHCGIQVGQPIGNKVMLESDLVLAIGCRFSDRHTGNLDVYRKDRKFIHIDIDQKQIGKVFNPELGIVSDAKLAIEALAQEAKDQNVKSTWDLVSEIPSMQKQLARKTDYDNVPIHPHRVFEELNKYFGNDAIFTTGCGNTQIWSGQLQNVDEPKLYIPSGGAGTLGYDIPAAFGANKATGKTAVAVMGDFGFTFHVQELGTCIKNNSPVIVVVLNNAYLGLIRQNQVFAYGYEYAVEMGENQSLIDFVEIAHGFGCYAERVFKPEEIKNALKRAKESGKTAVIDIICDTTIHCSMGNSIDAIKEF